MIGNTKAISKTFRNSKAFTVLDIRMNVITCKGKKMLSEGLRANTTFIELKLEMNKIGDEGIQELEYKI